VVVGAAGNDGGDLFGIEAPALFPSVVAVASVGQDGAVSPGVSAVGPEVAIAAPGSTDTCPLDSFDCTGYPAATAGDGYTTSFTGTSGATPIVAGTAALIIGANPGISAADVVNRLVQTAKNPAGPGERDEEIGFGVLDPVAAVTADVPSVDENPLGVPDGIDAYLEGAPGTEESSASTPTTEAEPTEETSVAPPTSSAPTSEVEPTTSATSPVTSAPVTSAEPTTESPSAPVTATPPAAAGENSGSAVPVWVWVLVGLGVVALAGVAVVLARRGRSPTVPPRA